MTTAEDIRQARAVVRLMHIRLRVADDETREALIEDLEELSEAAFRAMEAAVNYKAAAEKKIRDLNYECAALEAAASYRDPARHLYAVPDALLDVFSRKAPPEMAS